MGSSREWEWEWTGRELFIHLGGCFSITSRVYYKMSFPAWFQNLIFSPSAVKETQLFVRASFGIIYGSGWNYCYLQTPWMSLFPEYGTEFRDKPLKSSLSYKNIPYFSPEKGKSAMDTFWSNWEIMRTIRDEGIPVGNQGGKEEVEKH